MMIADEMKDLRRRLKQARAALGVANQHHMHTKAKDGVKEADLRLTEALYMLNVSRCRDLGG